MNRSASSKIILKSALMIILLIGMLTLVSLSYLYRLNIKTDQIDNNLHVKVQILFEMSQIIRDRSLDIYSMYLNDDAWKTDELFLRFHKRALRFIQLRDKLSRLELSPEQSQELEKALKIINKTQPLQEGIVDRIKEDNKFKVTKIIAEEDIPLENSLLAIFDNLVQLARKEAHDAQVKVDKQYVIAIYIILLLAIFIIVCTVFIMRFGIREIQRHEMTINWAAEHDHLTKTYNRRWLNKYFEKQGAVNDESVCHAVLYVDLDNFKPVNDKHGHKAGDQVLKDVVNLFHESIRKTDIVVRMGGDEFVILLEDCNANCAKKISGLINDMINSYHLSFDNKIISGLACSIGIGIVSKTVSWETALQRADEECYKVKHSSKDGMSSGFYSTK